MEPIMKTEGGNEITSIGKTSSSNNKGSMSVEKKNLLTIMFSPELK